MITNRGKEIIAKYMLGQAPAYATHISLGCGAKPVITGSEINVINKELSNNIITLTTDKDHDFYAGDSITVTNVGTQFDGTYTVNARVTPTILTYVNEDLNASVTVVSSSANGIIAHNYLNNQTMDFEMIRIPISSRGYVNEGGISKLALSAQMPTENRYEITEVALWSAGENGIVTNSDSKILFTFANNEGWVLHNTEQNGFTAAIPTYNEALDGGNQTGNITVSQDALVINKQLLNNSASLTYSGDNIFAVNQKVTVSGVGAPFDGTFTLTAVDITNKRISWPVISASVASSSANGVIKLPASIFGTYADNDSFLTATRKARQEGSRFLNYTILMRGDTSSIDSNFIVSSASAGVDSHIHLDSRNFNLSRNSPNDEIKVALSVISKDTTQNVAPYSTRIVIEFLTSEANTSTGYARLTHNIRSQDFSGDNRYLVITKKLSDLETASDFSWTNVRVTRAYVCVYEDEFDTSPSDNYFVALDAVRFNNVSTYNPLYAMTGYSVIDTATGYPIVKIENTNNYIEFRMALGVG